MIVAFGRSSLPSSPLHWSHIPASASGRPSCDVKQCGVFAPFAARRGDHGDGAAPNMERVSKGVQGCRECRAGRERVGSRASLLSRHSGMSGISCVRGRLTITL